MATRVISTSIKLDGEAEFKKQLSDVNSNLRTLDSEMKLVTEQFNGQANSADALRAKQKVLTDQIDQQEEKVRALEDALKDASVVYKDNDKKIDGYQQSLNRAKTELSKMQRELKETNGYLDEAEESADHAASSIDGFGREVRDAKSKLDKTERSARDAADSVKDFGGKSRDAKGDVGDFTRSVKDLTESLDKIPGASGLKDLVSGLEGLKGLAVGGVVTGAGISGVTLLADGIENLVDGTDDYRKTMGTLDSSSQAAGYTAEQTYEAYMRLYGVLGDYQTTATTVANLQAIGMEQEDLMSMIDLVTGAWAKYGDSIPIDGLAESINETIKTGQVTGTLADVLNWGSKENENFGQTMKDNIEFQELSEEELGKLTEAQREQYEKTKDQYESTKEFNQSLEDAKTAEDFFNIALGDTQTQADKTDKIMQAMRDQGLDEVTEGFRENEQGAIDARTAQAKYEEAQANLAEKLLPAKTAIVQLKTMAWDALTKSIEIAIETWKGALSFFSGENAEARAEMTVDETDIALKQAEEYKTTQALATASINERAVTASDLDRTAANVVNGTNAGRAAAGSTPTSVKTTINIDGKAVAEAVTPAMRDINKSNPEVVSDTL